jgi:hypothetical protein
MQCQELEQELERSGGGPLPAGATAHLATCSACQSLLADLESIGAAARELPREFDPPAHVWARLEAQLEAEGFIQAERAVGGWRDALRALFLSPGLATATAALLIVAAGLTVWNNGSQNRSLGKAQSGFEVASSALRGEERDVAAQPGRSDSLVDRSLRENLAIVDDFIAECERRVQEEPDNDQAREFLSNAYQQKAELLATMMDRSGGGD